MPLEVFYSYAHEDETLRDKLEEHLATLKRQGAIVGWHDRAIGAGQEWSNEIDEHVRSAHVILLLISASFLASDYCHDVEMRLALERHAAGDAVVIPIILRPVDWSGAEFARLQALPLNAKPVTTWANQDEAFLDIALGIRRVVERFGASKPPGGRPAVSPARVAPSARVLDAAIPSHIVKDEATELQVLIRLPESPGLRGLLASDDEADAREEDVNSKDFKITFPFGPAGSPEALKVKVLLTSPDFEPARQEKALLVPPDGDSELAAFLLTPRRLGKLKILVELFWDDVTSAPRRLLTQCLAEATSVPGNRSRHVVQIPLEVAPSPERPKAPPGVEAPRAAAPVSGPLRPLEYAPGGIRAVPVVDVLPRTQQKTAGKLGVAALSSAGLGAAIWFAVQRPLPPPEPPPVASLEACYEQVFKQAKIEKTSGLVDATLALLDGNIAAKTSGERVALYRELDSAAVRQSINGCNQQYNRKGLEVPIVVNLQASHQPLAEAKISLRNQLSSPVLTNADGKASLSIPLAAIERETVPLAVDWRGARFDLDATLIDLEHGKPLDLGKVGTLELRIVAPSCSGQAAPPAQSVVLHLPEGTTARVWTADGPRDPTAPLRANVVNGLAKFQYRGSLDAFEITVEGNGVRESYGRPPASRDQFDLVFPKECRIVASATKRPCPALEDAVQQRLATHRGATVSQVTITPTASGFRCSISSACDGLGGLFESRWRECARFVANVRTD
jgi:hypothetical protein